MPLLARLKERFEQTLNTVSRKSSLAGALEGLAGAVVSPVPLHGRRASGHLQQRRRASNPAVSSGGGTGHLQDQAAGATGPPSCTPSSRRQS